MYTTFAGVPAQSKPDDQPGAPSHSPARPKRNQVARACDWCRAHRIKCDSSYPCFNCRDRGGQCTNKGTSEVRTLPHAVRYGFRYLELPRKGVRSTDAFQRDRTIEAACQRIGCTASETEPSLAKQRSLTSESLSLLQYVPTMLACGIRSVERAWRIKKTLGRHTDEDCTFESDAILRAIIFVLLHRPHECLFRRSAPAAPFGPPHAA